MNPYEVLGVERTATAAEIRAAYRTRAKRAHPDVGGDRAEFERINRCYELLTDPERRAKYDETGDLEEDTPDNSHVEPLALVSRQLQELIAQADRPHEVDLVAALKRRLEQIRGALAEARQQGMRERAKARELVGRFSVKKGRDNFLEGIIAQRVQMIELGLRKIEHEDKVAAAAKALLKGAKFAFDVPAPEPSPYSAGGSSPRLAHEKPSL